MAKDLNLSVTLKAINKATGPLKKILQGSRGVGRAMKETRGELKDFNDQQKRISAFRDMSRQSQQTRDVLREKRQALDQVNQELKNATGPTKRLTQQQAKAQAAVDKLNGEYRDQRERVRELSRNLPKAADGTRGLTAQQEALDRQIRETNDRLNRQRDAMSRLANADVSGRFNKMSGEIGRLGRRTLMAGGAAATGIFAIANSTADLGDDVGKTAAKLGLTNAELQELRYAGERSGVATKTLDSSMVAFTKRLGEAADGSGAAVKGYEALGLNAQELVDMPVSEAMREVADRMAQIENPTRRNAIAAQLYSRAGVGLVNMLKDGSGGLDDYAAAAERTGYMLDDEATAGSESFKDALLDTQLSLKGIKNTIGAELMPAVEDMMRDLSGWLAENRDEVKQFAKAFGENLKAAVPIITDLAKGSARLATGIGDVVAKTANMVGGYENLAMIAGGLFASKALLSVISFGVGVGKAIGAMAAFAKTLPIVATGVKALSAAFAATPIGWIIAGIAAIAGAAYLIYKNWDWIGPWFGQLWEGIKAKAGAAWDWLKRLFDWSPIATLRSAWQGMGNITGAAVDSAKDTASAAWEGIKTLFRWSPLGLIARAWQGLSSTIGSPLELAKVAVANAWSSIKALFDWSPMATIRSTWSGIKAAFDEGIGGVTRLLVDWSPLGILWRGISAALSTLGIELPTTLSGLGGALIDGLIGGIDAKWQALKDKITGMASGVTGWFKEALGINSPSKVFAGFGGNLLDGLVNGIDEKWQMLKDSIGNTASAVTGWFKDKLGINSPSKVFAEFGVNTMEGYQQGIKREEDAPLREVSAFAKSLRQAAGGLMLGSAALSSGGAAADSAPLATPSFDARAPLAAAPSGGGLTIEGGINITVQATPGMDEQALSRYVAAEVQRALANAEHDAGARRRSAFHDID
ncbi:hypothetical protein [Halomonas llamarensis]|uniref:Phage tail tape measure protein n=1 Tax=Halomonas llamarensis TaxID=2945104 RepID=A0ABT0SSA9_9GAMM|nr:hypothetical protein [Halomonas llamarensis]MCL7930448.1 hypothetical protein [Halomonas llamarensis]